MTTDFNIRMAEPLVTALAAEGFELNAT